MHTIENRHGRERHSTQGRAPLSNLLLDDKSFDNVSLKNEPAVQSGCTSEGDGTG